MNQKKKVLFLLEAFDKGGIEKVTLDIVNHLDPEKYDITVQTFWYGGYCQSQVRDHVTVRPFFFKRYVRGIIRLIAYLPPKWLYRLFVRGRYDVEIAASDGGAAKVIAGSTNQRAKKICWVHMDVVNRGSKLKEFQNEETARRIYEKFDWIVPVSEACRDRFQEKFGTSYPILVQRNPMPADEILAKANQKVPVPAYDGLLFVCVGRLVEQKGFDRLLDACVRLQREQAGPFHVLIIGEGPERASLEQQLRAACLEGVVHLLGFQENPYPYLRQADGFLLTSRDEAFSLVVGESLIAGTPVIATDCCGVGEWLEDGTYGLIVENSTEGIYAGMRRALREPDLLAQYRRRIPEAQKKISFDAMLKDFEGILETENG